MKRILLAYTSNSGSTEDVAREIGQGLAGDGVQVDVVRFSDVAAIEPYDAVVVGAPMIMGWHSAALKFLKQHQAALAQKPVAYFFTAMYLTGTGQTEIAGVPIFVDPTLAHAPRNPKWWSFKEWYGAPANYLRPALRAAPRVKPVTVAFLGGRLELFRLKLWQVLFVLLIIRARPGDLRNWDCIRAWAADLRERLGIEG